MINKLFITSQIQIDNNIKIPETMPDIGKVDEILSEICINRKYIVKTPVGESADETYVNGNKIMVHWILKQKILYIAVPGENLHAFDARFEFLNGIILPLTAIYLPESICDLLTVVGRIENIAYSVYDKRSIMQNLSVALEIDKDLYEYYFKSYNLSKIDPLEILEKTDYQEDE